MASGHLSTIKYALNGEHSDRPEVLARLRSGDGPLSVSARPSSLKHDYDRRTMGIGKYLVGTNDFPIT